LHLNNISFYLFSLDFIFLFSVFFCASDFFNFWYWNRSKNSLINESTILLYILIAFGWIFFPKFSWDGKIKSGFTIKHITINRFQMCLRLSINVFLHLNAYSSISFTLIPNSGKVNRIFNSSTVPPIKQSLTNNYYFLETAFFSASFPIHLI